MENGLLTIVHYDRDNRGCVRLYKNTHMISEALPKGLEVEILNVDRLKTIKGERGIEDILLTEPFIYGAIIINESAMDSGKALEAAKVILEVNSLPLKKIIYLVPKGLAYNIGGIQYVHAKGGNGYLAKPNDPKEVVNRLLEII